MSLLDRVNANRCTEPGCRREPRYPDLARCDEHRLRWMPGQPVEPRKPAWVERMQKNAKILGPAA